ncbi:hypothetical protein [Schaalia suimastitidis]|uniref:hypothetical protein n=1 Tax=Schaalia suimastitidis TaxID=121163 RepID=UPI0003F97C03|nr:hypothetical protein [Schaalia suimastitidis]
MKLRVLITVLMASALVAACGLVSTDRGNDTTHPVAGNAGADDASSPVTNDDSKESGIVEEELLENFPYPASVAYLDSILALSPGADLPEGAYDIEVRPALKFAESYPGGWGYVISLKAEPEAIVTYIEKHTGLGAAIDSYATVTQEDTQTPDIDLSTISRPWSTGFGNAELIVERPLGRMWIQILGAPR